MKISILGVKIDNFSEVEVLGFIRRGVELKKKFWVVTPNPEFVTAAYKDKGFCDLLNKADLAVPDGVGLVLASYLLGKPLKGGRVTGVDLMEKLCRGANGKPWRVFLLGGKGGIAQEALRVLKDRYQVQGSALEGLQIEGTKKNGWRFDKRENERVIRQINRARPDFLFVGFGMGKQEHWIEQNLPQLEVLGVMGVGGAFDYLSGKIQRAPKWIREIGFEWFYRLLRQPRRLKRQLALIEFVYLVLREKMGL